MNKVVEMTGRHEPPAPRTPVVIGRLKIAQRELADLKLQIAERVLAVAEGRPDAKENLKALHQTIAAVEFEVQHYPAARALAEALDQEAVAAWKAHVQTLPPAVIVDGITKEACPRFCGAGAGCCISGADALSGPCCHPLREGLMLTRYKENPQIVTVFSAACKALSIRSNR